ncbi:MAG: AAA family ATPase, partial [Chloroflexi bacterium]|nr:AAA family ATPase [Chloroflexota bacterium]
MGLIGRDVELGRLSASLERAAEGTTDRVLLLGSLGSGASRLLNELERRLADLPTVTVARAAAYEPCAGVPYLPLASALRGALQELPDERLLEVVGNAGYDLSTLIPDLAPRLDGLRALPDRPLISAPDQLASRITESLLGALERLAGPGIVLLALEDLQWADPGTRAFVQSLVRSTRRLPLCLIGTLAPDELHRRHPATALADALRQHPSVERIHLDPLDRDALLRLLRQDTEERPSGAFVAAVMEGSGGNPLIAEHLAAAHRSVEGLRLSEPFEEIMHARLAAIGPLGVRCLGVLAAARRPLPRSLLLGLPLAGGRLSRQGLEDALASGLAFATRPAAATGGPGGVGGPGGAGGGPGGAGGGLDGAGGGPGGAGGGPVGPAAQEPAIGVVHQLYAEAIEGLMPAAQSRAIHHALADALPHPAEQAWHREAAFDFPGARAAHVRAAAESESLEPGGTTLLHYERALELAEVDEERSGVAAGSPGTADHRVEASASPLLGRAAQAAFVAGSFRRAAGLIEQAIDQRASRAAIAAALARDDVASRVLLTEVGTLYERLGRARWASGDLQPALSALDNALQVIPDSPSRERAGALAALAQHLMLDGRFADSAGLAEQACAVARAVGDAALAELGHATCTLGVDRAYG